MKPIEKSVIFIQCFSETFKKTWYLEAAPELCNVGNKNKVYKPVE